MNTSVVAGLEQQLEDSKKLIERRNLAAKLANNRDFRILILEGFCRDDAARYAHEAGDPALTKEQREDAMAMAMAGGHLKRYLSAHFQMGAVAERELEQLEEALAEARVEADAADDEIPNGDGDND